MLNFVQLQPGDAMSKLKQLVGAPVKQAAAAEEKGQQQQQQQQHPSTSSSPGNRSYDGHVTDVC